MAPPGVLLAAGKSVTFTIETEATAVRVIAMVAPTLLPDTYVTNVVDLTGADTFKAELTRFDIGFDEGTKMIAKFTGKKDTGDTMATDSAAASSDTMAAATHPKGSAATITFEKVM